MATLEHRNHARSFLRKAEEYLASAEANLTAERYTVAAGDAIHAGILREGRHRHRTHRYDGQGQGPRARREALRQALGQRPDAASAEKGLRDLVSSKADVEYCVTTIAAVKAESLVRRARSPAGLAVRIVRLNG